jgi:hypothetical protein
MWHSPTAAYMSYMYTGAGAEVLIGDLFLQACFALRLRACCAHGYRACRRTPSLPWLGARRATLPLAPSPRYEIDVTRAATPCGVEAIQSLCGG